MLKATPWCVLNPELQTPKLFSPESGEGGCQKHCWGKGVTATATPSSHLPNLWAGCVQARFLLDFSNIPVGQVQE